MRIPFIGPTYQSRSPNIAADRCINFFPEINAQDSKDIISLIGTPGTAYWTSLGAFPVRGMHVVNNVLYAVAMNKLYSISAGGVVSASLGTLNTQMGRVSMADNGVAVGGIGGNQLCIVDGTALYIWNVNTSTFSGGSPASYPVHVAYIDGYFIVTCTGSMSAYCSNLYNGTSWNALATAQISASPDPIQTVVDLNQQLYFIKSNTVEIWYDAGVATSVGFPFARVVGGVLDGGTPAPWSVAKMAGSLFMLGNLRNQESGELMGVVQISAYQFNVISTPAIAYQIQQWGSWSDAFGYCYSAEGHNFYVLTSPSANQTVVYDMTTQMWHERSTYTDYPYAYSRHIGNCYVYFNNKHYVGDYQTGNIYEMNSATYTDNLQPIISVRQAQHQSDKNTLNNIFVHKIIIDAETGVGGTGAYTSLAWSDDGGHTWSNDYLASVGNTGQYKKRLVWRRLGVSRDRVFRLTMPEATKKIVIGAVVEASE